MFVYLFINPNEKLLGLYFAQAKYHMLLPSMWIKQYINILFVRLQLCFYIYTKPKPVFMDQTYTTSSSSLFSLSIDPSTKAHLLEAAKWARFLAIVSMIFLVIGIVGGVFYAMFIGTMMNSFETEYGNVQESSNGFVLGMAMYMLVISIVWFFPLMYLLRFANRMRTALNGNDQQALNTSVQNLKICFRYLGIVTIIALGLLAIGVVFGIIGAAAM